MSGEQKHQFHLVEPSPWPVVGSAAGFTLALGGAMFMHDYPYSGYIVIAGFLMLGAFAHGAIFFIRDYDPEINKNTILLWVLPLILFVFGSLLIIRKLSIK